MGKQLLINEARRLEEDLLWSMTACFQIATYWRMLHWAIGIPSVLTAAITGIKAVKTGDPQTLAYFAIASAVLSALATFVNPGRSAREFHNAGVRCSALRGKLRRFWQIDATLDDPNLRKKLEKLADEKSHLMETMPHTGGLAYWLAARSIGKGQNTHEIDKVPTGA
ncbi:SLATT domain-containing protein [Mesorhizobium sp. CO1-1-11]|uniref:SLATT domain-containing protein n=1 Tax=Mesorhizobium sp. CO1-1-11 TaxID=2876636 RepID=UPI001CCB10CC|nr:SLATT domain-containing protein [Mesorhizobium sp. CO1-1-11]MBZ9725277.1 SLATT domain-containing protein [Mesorhizobium sp. CO1-1-11]